jgi:hypothetical protein
MNGAWGDFPFFASGTVIIGDMVSGMFVVAPQASVLEKIQLMTALLRVSGMSVTRFARR